MENSNNQGKRPDQYETGARYAGYALIGIVGLIVILTLLTGCGVSKESQKCSKESQKCCKQETTIPTPPHDPLNN